MTHLKGNKKNNTRIKLGAITLPTIIILVSSTILYKYQLKQYWMELAIQAEMHQLLYQEITFTLLGGPTQLL